ncbi:MAG: hypothetical protein OER22_03635 [Gammaproteobacteria bacterium]|nr:hypothetical protein [Gammaproteobacteria bacterium]MDH3374963.1 hypothetical protein [Gammaproteobacteria bacterium]MDH3410236.1 hypothetical protein [Gammaproteobacteria bacterium]MDH3551687.1 hypothetical protein [Gammaproteobacteria bacterium]
MSESRTTPDAPADVTAIIDCGYATWARDDVDDALRARFAGDRIPVTGVRHVRVWGLQVDDERELPGRERTQIPDEEIWEVNLVSADGSHYEVDSRLLKPAP